MIIGGVSCASRDVVWINAEIASIRSKQPHSGDSLQWKRLTNHRKLDKYQRLLDLFRELNSEHVLDYAAIVIDTYALRHKRYNEGDAENFFQKMMCEFVEARVSQYERPKTLRCFHGQRNSRYHLSEIRRIINQTILSRSAYEPLLQLEYMNVSKSSMHQLTDTLLGCTAFHWNEKMRRNIGSPKSELAHYANANLCARSLAEATRWKMRHFDLWKIRLRD